MFGVPPNPLPLVIYIGIFCYWVLLHYNMSFKTIAGGLNGAFWTCPPSADQENVLKTLFVEAWFKKILNFDMSVLYNDVQNFRRSINSQEYKSFTTYVVTIKIYVWILYVVIVGVVLFSRISRVSPRENFHFNMTI